jgi:hypothetical protein
VSWSDLLQAFAARSDLDPAAFRRQWIERTGAPTLRLEEAGREGDMVVFTLSQGLPPYALDVPVVVATPGDSQEHVVALTTQREEFRIQASGATGLRIDPDYHLFRRLDPREIEPTISQVLAEEAPVFSLPAGAPAYAEPGEAFARNFVETELVNLFLDGELPLDVAPEHAASAVLLRRDEGEIPGNYIPPGVTLAGGSVYLEGKRYSLAEFDLVYTVADPFNTHVTDLVVVTRGPERLESLARRLGHYGKYSWLLLPTGRGQVLKGNWEPPGGPLAIDFQE